MTILAATDLSPHSTSALRMAAWLAYTREEPLLLVCVSEVGRNVQVDAMFRTFCEAELADRPQPTTIEREVLKSPETPQSVARILSARARDVGASLIVAGTTGQGWLARRFLGGTTRALIHESAVPMMAVPPDGERPLRRILAPVDYSDCSRRSLNMAVEWARSLDAELVVLHVAPFTTGGAPDDARAQDEPRLAAFLEGFDLHDIPVSTRIDFDRPGDGVVRIAARLDTDLIVMGSHGREGVAKLVLGSNAELVLREAPCPVLIVRSAP